MTGTMGGTDTDSEKNVTQTNDHATTTSDIGGKLQENFDGLILYETRLSEISTIDDTIILQALENRKEKLLLSKHNDLTLALDGKIMWEKQIVGTVQAGADILNPIITLSIDNRYSTLAQRQIEIYFHAFVLNRLRTLFPSLLRIAEFLQTKNNNTTNQNTDNKQNDELPTPLSEDGYHILKALISGRGIISRYEYNTHIKAIATDERVSLRKLGVRFGQRFIYLVDACKTRSIQARLLFADPQIIPPADIALPNGLVSYNYNPELSDEYYRLLGLCRCENLLIRIDILERFCNNLWQKSKKSPENPEGAFQDVTDLMSLVGRSGEDFEGIMKFLGYRYREETIPSETNPLNDNLQQSPSKETIEDGNNTQENITEKAIQNSTDKNETKIVKVWFFSGIPHTRKTSATNIEKHNNHRNKKTSKQHNKKYKNNKSSTSHRKANSTKQPRSPQNHKCHIFDQTSDSFAALADLKRKLHTDGNN